MSKLSEQVARMEEHNERLMEQAMRLYEEREALKADDVLLGAAKHAADVIRTFDPPGEVWIHTLDILTHAIARAEGKT